MKYCQYVPALWHLISSVKWEAEMLYGRVHIASTRSWVFLWRHLQVDFWSPESAEVVTVGTDVDIRVPAIYLDMLYTLLQQSDMEHRQVTRGWCKIKVFQSKTSWTRGLMWLLYWIPSLSVLIEDLQAAVDGQADLKPTPRAHSYTKYNTWTDVRS